MTDAKTYDPTQSFNTSFQFRRSIPMHTFPGLGGPIRRQQLALSNSYSGFVCLQNRYLFGTHSSRTGKVPTHMRHSDVIYATLGSRTRALVQCQPGPRVKRKARPQQACTAIRRGCVARLFVECFFPSISIRPMAGIARFLG